MADAPINPYLRTKVLTASPAELRLILIEAAIRFADQAKTGLTKKDYEQSYFGTTRCQDSLLQLIEGLRPEVDRELCDRLRGLYVYMYTRLMNATSERDPEIVSEVIKLLEFERETWSMVLDQLDQERDSNPVSNTNQTTRAAPDSFAAIQPKHKQASPVDPGLIGGSISVSG